MRVARRVVGLVAVVACARQAPQPQLTAVTTQEVVAVSSGGGRVVADTGVMAQRRREGMVRANAAGRLVDTILANPDRVELTVNQGIELRDLVRVVARDSSGAAVTGWAPSYSLGNYSIARLLQGRVVGVRPGTTELRVEAMVFDDTTFTRPVRRKRTSIPVHVVAEALPPYVRPGTPPRSAAQVAEAFLAALGAGQWVDAAQYVDLSRFEPFLRSRVSQARVALPDADPTLEQFIAGWGSRGTETPRAVLEWQYEQMVRSRKSRPPFGDFSHEFTGVTTFKALAELTPADAAARWLEARDERTRMRRVAREAGCDSTAVASSIMSSSRGVRRLVAVAPASDSTAWALHHPRASIFPSAYPAPEPPPELLLLRRATSGAWLVDVQPPGGSGMSFGSSMNLVNCPTRPTR